VEGQVDGIVRGVLGISFLRPYKLLFFLLVFVIFSFSVCSFDQH
jgi:hypothetical protein